MGKAKKTRKFAQTKRIISAKDQRMYVLFSSCRGHPAYANVRKKNQDKVEKPKKDEELVREM